jgi:hypothetical protein
MKTLTLLMLVLGLAWPGNGFAADVDYFGVIKLQQFYQTNASAPVIGSNGYSFQAFVNASSSFSVTNASVKPSNANPLRTLAPNSDGTIWRFEEAFASQALLDSAYTAGSGFSPVNYAVNMQTVNDGTRSANLNFVLFFSLVSYPGTLQVQNWLAAQNIDHTADFTLTWNTPSVSILPILQLVILDISSNVVYSTPAPFQPGALSGSSTQAIIPAFSLPPGTNLIGHLTVANLGTPNTNSYPGAIGVPALAKDTFFSIVTRPAPLTPHLETRLRSSGNFVLRVSGESNRWYHVQATTTFGAWTNLLTTNSVSGVFDYADPSSSSFPARFYRARTGQ